MTSAAKVSRRRDAFAPHRPRWYQRWAAWAICASVKMLASTLRARLHDPRGVFARAPLPQVIFAIWHNRLALCLSCYGRYVRRVDPKHRMAAIVSASKDGALLARVLELFQVQPVRGSTSRRGPQALLELTSWAERGLDLAITPDGPRGPRYRVQEGPIALAQITGLPVVPIAYWTSWKLTLKSWDGFQVPLPFARWEVAVGEPLCVPREATDAQREALRAELEARMRALTRD
jgi:lysophospholipid acyltransferase (LPLAT)-like uncharacterized protein